MNPPPLVEMTEKGVFTLLVLLMVLLLVILSLFYPYRAGLAPLAIGIPTAVFLLIQFLSDWFPRLKNRFRVIEDTSLRTMEIPLASEGISPISLRRREFALLLWLSGLLLLFSLLGILLAVPLFAFAYLRFWSGSHWWLVISYSLGTWLAVYLLLVKLLDAQLPTGILFRWLGI